MPQIASVVSVAGPRTAGARLSAAVTTMPLMTRATTETSPEPVESNRPPGPILINGNETKRNEMKRRRRSFARARSNAEARRPRSAVPVRRTRSHSIVCDSLRGMTVPQEAFPGDADDVERHPCPRCRVEPGSPCRSRSGAVAGTYHTGRFTKVPRLAELLRKGQALASRASTGRAPSTRSRRRIPKPSPKRTPTSPTSRTPTISPAPAESASGGRTTRSPRHQPDHDPSQRHFLYRNYNCRDLRRPSAAPA